MWWIAAAVVLAVVAGSGGWLLLRGDGGAAATTATTAKVTTTTIEQAVSASGTVEPASTADLDFDVSGTVTHVYVAAGDTVKKGQRLAEVGATALEAARTAAQSTLDAAREQLTVDTDAAASDVQLAADETAVVSAQASLDEADQAVQDAVLRASIAGTVTSLGLEVGDTVGSGSGSGGAASGSGSSGGASTGSSATSTTSAVTIVSSGSYIVDATVASSDVASVKKGLQAKVTVTGVADTVYGTVQSVGLVAQTNNSGAAVFPVTIKVTGKRDDLYAGTSATASIVVKQTPNVLVVPSRALRSSGSTTYVMKMVAGKATRTTVRIGQAYGAQTQVVSGLSDGDTVEVQGFVRPSGSGAGGTGGTQRQGEFPGGFPGGGGFGGGTFGGGVAGGGQ
ncbi:MacA family efflux pump subunit [Nocardioides panacihumi]|uniref:MacA family efflux pump subunit n=1 Tax=Nocardioides panacihumi TaxID=400774 RepID=A0ABP5CGP3_9ACTN